jgi:hypothetical protein
MYMDLITFKIPMLKNVNWRILVVLMLQDVGDVYFIVVLVLVTKLITT